MHRYTLGNYRSLTHERYKFVHTALPEIIYSCSRILVNLIDPVEKSSRWSGKNAVVPLLSPLSSRCVGRDQRFQLGTKFAGIRGRRLGRRKNSRYVPAGSILTNIRGDVSCQCACPALSLELAPV